MGKKVIHILKRLDRGGVEMWLKELTEVAYREDVHFIFLTMREGEGYYDSEVKKFGAEIVSIDFSNKISFFWNLFRFFKKQRDAVVHSHVLNFSGVILFIAYLAGMKKRIAHSHSDKSAINAKASVPRKIYLNLTKWLLRRFASVRIACSEKAGKGLFEKDFIVIDNGINLSKFPEKNITERKNLLTEFGIPEDCLVIGHVGRFSFPKNHEFIIDLGFELEKTGLNFVILLVGNGNLQEKIRNSVVDQNLDSRIHFLGARDDIPNLMVNLFDLMVFPSLWEGMPLTLIEAQQAKLFTIASDTIPKDVFVIKELFKILPIDKGARLWADGIEEYNISDTPEVVHGNRLDRFSIDSCFRKLNDVYSK